MSDSVTTTQYEIEALHDRYGRQEWDRTGHGYFDTADEARTIADGMSSYQTRIVRIETTRTPI